MERVQLPHFSTLFSALADPLHLFARKHFLLVYCPLLGAKFCHTCSCMLEARPFRSSKSLVLDSMVLLERHVSSVRRLYFHNRTVDHCMYSLGRLKP